MEQENKFVELLEERRNPQKEFWSTLRFFVALLAIFLCFTILFTQILIGIQVVGTSMEPTLYSGDYLFIDTTRSLGYGDIVVIEANEKDSVHDSAEHKWIIKRVIGLPGDTIRAKDGVLERRCAGEAGFERVIEHYLDPADGWKEDIEETKIEENKLFVMGDHRSISLDSRKLGQFPLSSVMGVVTDWSLASKEFLSKLFGIF